MLDGGATVTLLKSSVADELGLDGEPHNLDLQFVNSNKKIDSKLVALKISGETGKEFTLHNVQTTDNLNLPVKSTNIQKLAEKWDYLKKIRLNDVENVQPTLLIGNDNANLIVLREVIDGPGNSPVLSRTKLGWVFHGNASHFKGRVDDEFLLHTWNKEENDDIVQLMKMNYSTESFGVRVTAEKPRSKENIKSQEIMNATIKRIGNRFETGLLWRDEHPKLPESKAVALKRLHGMERKMDKDKIFEEKYSEKIQDYVLKGYARKLSPEEALIPKDNLWYLPHFGVINVNKPGKLRFVFDAAAKSNGKSLNDFLMTGPDQLCSLVGVLFKFRQYKIGFSGDIAEMFHQVRVRKEDCPAQRFLWRENDKTKPPDVYEMSVMTFGASCSPSLAQEVKNKNAKEFNDEFPDATKAIINRHYVDDYLDSCDTEKEAIESIRNVREVHRRGGFEIRGWASSSKNVLQAVSENNIDSNETKEMNLESDLPMERVLGMKWNPNTDVFTFNCKYEKINEDLLNGIKRPTKREMLKIVMSIFDPLGFLCNFTVKAKINLQDVWRTGIGWDDEIQEDNFNKWKKWLIELKRIQEIEIPRNYSPRMGISTDVTLHIFCDASQQAFDTVAFFVVNGNEKIDVGFVMAKSRVAPLRPLSIPRLELQAAVMASRLYLLIIEEHEIKINRVVFWSDSTTVLYWLRSDARRYKPFVSHRIGEIMENCDVADWRWVPTDENVADEATRDNKDVDFSKTSRWLNGPSFLKLPEDKWPQEPNEIKIDNAVSECELKSEFVNFISEDATCLLDISKYSSYNRLLGTAGWILRFVNRCKKMENKHESLLPAEIIMAEKVLLKNVQTESFANEIQDLLKGKNVCKSSKLFTLSPIIDEDGIVRVKGRTLKSPEMNDETKRPVILDSKHPFTKLLIKFYHENYAHQGQELVMNELRQKYWIINLRVAVKKVWRNCQVCRIVKAKPVTPEMGNLPKERITKYVRPFTMVGMDYFGPYEVTIGRRREKRYGVLFSCLTTRAVHLELAHSLSTDSAIMAIVRMISRSGCPTEIFSDNGTNLKGADVEMKKAIESLNQQKIMENLTTKGITWKFIPASSPHMAGAWERLVQSVKRSLKTILKEQAPREETLQTFFAEVENIVNSRPLTFVSNDPNDLQSITPNNFLIGTTSGTPIMGNFTEDKLCTRKQWIVAQNLSENFWKRWIKEYLPTLTKRTKWHLATKPIKEGDLVFIADGTLFKNHWPRGIVTATYPGADGVIRVVDVKTQYGILRRPVVKLCIIDVDQDGV